IFFDRNSILHPKYLFVCFSNLKIFPNSLKNPTDKILFLTSVGLFLSVGKKNICSELHQIK
ncbi:MAG TPA: hypothetical protein VGD14_17515, partial [bacterium]